MMKKPILAAIVARSRNGVIGRDGDLPWRLSSDLKHFKRLTVGTPCVMGRKTWESLPGALPKRPMLVLTRQVDYKAQGAEVFQTVRALLGRAHELAGAIGSDQISIIGGAQFYARLLPITDRIYETEVQAEIDGDALFPTFSREDWKKVDEAHHSAGPRDDFAFVTRQWDRVRA
jgi:dihydrofolate reductase